jgi:hypothetical protein
MTLVLQMFTWAEQFQRAGKGRKPKSATIQENDSITIVSDSNQENSSGVIIDECTPKKRGRKPRGFVAEEKAPISNGPHPSRLQLSLVVALFDESENMYLSNGRSMRHVLLDPEFNSKSTRSALLRECCLVSWMR